MGGITIMGNSNKYDNDQTIFKADFHSIFWRNTLKYVKKITYSVGYTSILNLSCKISTHNKHHKLFIIILL